MGHPAPSLRGGRGEELVAEGFVSHFEFHDLLNLVSDAVGQLWGVEVLLFDFGQAVLVPVQNLLSALPVLFSLFFRFFGGVGIGRDGVALVIGVGVVIFDQVGCVLFPIQVKGGLVLSPTQANSGLVSTPRTKTCSWRPREWATRSLKIRLEWDTFGLIPCLFETWGTRNFGGGGALGAAAVGVMRFGRGCARMLSFSFFPYFEGWSEFLSGGSEDDAADDGGVGLFIPRLRIETWGTRVVFPTQANTGLEWATVVIVFSHPFAKNAKGWGTHIVIFGVDLFPIQANTVGLLFILGFVEGAGLEVGLAGAEQAVEGVGRLRGDAAVVERAHDQKTVGLDGGAVLGIEEGQGAVQVVELWRHDGAGHGAPDDAVMTAIWASGDGRLRATAPGGQKIAAEFVHTVSFLVGCEPMSLRDMGAPENRSIFLPLSFVSSGLGAG